MTKFVGIIPARYASTRFPGKPLADIGGMTMIERVYTQASRELDNVWVATDDTRIYDAVEAFGGQVVMTSANHRSGTDRCHEAMLKVAPDADAIINIQGDEPFIDPTQIARLQETLTQPDTEIATLVRQFDPAKGFDALFNPNTPKVVFDSSMRALYFSRSIIPYVRNCDWKQWLDNATFFTHIGMYGYRADALERIVTLPPSTLEIAESLEQLRWLQNGMTIRVAVTDCETIGIDTPADLEAARKWLAERL
ncbi:MAG: 3-deoxy-manno-octulosonate cytidylyltransferase [Paramuribaculum sp.]|nr:3-deoxy-manno-octulosonate cytidylyltransferase [Paramuribaculum sp.]